jgi:hypothetical protein
MPDRDLFTVDVRADVIRGLAMRKVSHNLMAIEIKVNPILRTATFWTPKQAAIERARLLEIIDWEG